MTYKKSKSDISKGHSQSVSVNDSQVNKEKTDRKPSPGMQHKNSSEQDFNNKGNRKLRPAKNES